MKEMMMMRKFLLAGAMLGLLVGVAGPMKATALTLDPASLSTPAIGDSMVVKARAVAWRGPRGGGVAWRRGWRGGGVAWRRGWRGGGVAWRRGWRGGGVAWRRGWRGGGVAWRRGWARPGWRVGWVGPGFYYNPAFYNRYYNPRWGYCRIVTWNGGRVCRWYRRPWW
jgi:hypothetical protein